MKNAQVIWRREDPEQAIYSWKAVSILIGPSFGSTRQRDGLKAVRTQRQIEYRIATHSALASHV